MDSTAVLRELEALGTEQNRKVYRRHGASEPLFGVSYADLGKLQKRIKKDHALARALWAAGYHEARVLATMVADPAAADLALLDSWAAGLPGSRSDALAAKASAAAARLGKVEVDHGETGCKTPDAAAYIRKTREHRTKSAAGKTRR